MSPITRRAALLGGVVALVPALARGGKKPRHRRTRDTKQRRRDARDIVITDRTGPLFAGQVAPMVALFSAAMPKGAPRLVYTTAPRTVCTDVRDFTICSGDITATLPGGGEVVGLAGGRAVLDEAHPAMQDATTRQIVLCHELMHMLTGIRDCYGCRQDSCVHGWLDHPGAFDIAALRRAFV